MGGWWSSEATKVTLWVRVKPDPELDLGKAHRPRAQNLDGTERSIELEVSSNVTISEVKYILKERHHVFLDLPVDAWNISISGMDGNPRMFAFPTGTTVPDDNAFLHECGINEAAELIAYVPES
mmetsp:Transcript_32290/g.50341  ORF Transcript_32290/g.50341 Transcript_32290/m.50341 type:complete len:124 (+) Transcript_32290:54-425(+)